MSLKPQPLNELVRKVFAARMANAPAVGEVRRSCFTPQLRGIDEKNRVIDFVASTEAVDRYGDRLMTKGWKLDTYKKNPIFLWAHRSQDPPIGKTLDVHVETAPVPALVQKVQFADKATYEFADTIFNLYGGGYLRSVSVGFLPTEPPEPITDEATGRTSGFQFNAMELLELSAVPIPANPEAVARAVDERIITRDDAAKVFIAPKEELATAGDYVELAFQMGQLHHAARWLEVVVKTARGIRSPEDLAQALGISARQIGSVADLEKLFRLS
jgi:hypothetical protein